MLLNGWFPKKNMPLGADLMKEGRRVSVFKKKKVGAPTVPTDII
jgi:hypothetical protein